MSAAEATAAEARRKLQQKLKDNATVLFDGASKISIEAAKKKRDARMARPLKPLLPQTADSSLTEKKLKRKEKKEKDIYIMTTEERSAVKARYRILKTARTLVDKKHGKWKRSDRIEREAQEKRNAEAANLDDPDESGSEDELKYRTKRSKPG